MKFLLIFSFYLLSGFSYAGVDSANIEKIEHNKKESNLIQFEVKLKSYSKNDFFMDFTNGGSESFDASKVVVIKPLKYEGKTLVFINTGLAGQSKKWRKKGANFFISMREEFVDSVFIDVRLVKFVNNQNINERRKE